MNRLVLIPPPASPPRPRATYVRVEIDIDIADGTPVADALFYEAPSIAVSSGGKPPPLVADDGLEHVERSTGVTRVRWAPALDRRPRGPQRQAAVALGAALYLDGEPARKALRQGIVLALAALALEGGGR